MKSIVIAALFLALGLVTASDQIPGAPQDHPIALVGGTIYPVAAAPIEAGTLVFENGRITAIGKEIAVPVGAEVLDISGKSVYPGLIESTSRLGLVEVNAVRATRDYEETGNVNPNVRAVAAINPDSELIPVTRANGVALAGSLPAGGLISGQAAFVALDGWNGEQMAIKSPLAMVVQWPNMTLRRGGRVRATPKEQQKQIDKDLASLNQAFLDARAYFQALTAAEAANRPAPRVDVRWQAMVPVFKKELPVWVFAENLKQIRAAVDFKLRHDFRMVLVGAKDAPLVADLLRAYAIPVIVQGVLALPERRDDPYDHPFTLAARLHHAGIEFCISGSSFGGNERNLPYHAAMAAAYGLAKDEALKSITLYPARILGVADRVGSLAVGMDATLIVTDGDPLEIPTRVERMFIQGRTVDLGNKHSQLNHKYRAKYGQAVSQ